MYLLKVGTHDGTSPCNKSQGLVASCELATSPCDQLQGPVASCEQAIFASKSRSRDELQSLRLVPQIQTSLNSRDQSQGPNFGRCDQILWQKLPVHTMRLVPAICCIILSCKSILSYGAVKDIKMNKNSHISVFRLYFCWSPQCGQLAGALFLNSDWLWNNETLFGFRVK